MNILDEIMEQVKLAKKDIKKVEDSIKLVHEEDFKTLGMMNKVLISTKERLDKLIVIYHKVSQDLGIGNEEARARIDKLTGVTSEVEDLSEIYNDIYGKDTKW